jgi:hypothetical protein
MYFALQAEGKRAIAFTSATDTWRLPHTDIPAHIQQCILFYHDLEGVSPTLAEVDEDCWREISLNDCTYDYIARLPEPLKAFAYGPEFDPDLKIMADFLDDHGMVKGANILRHLGGKGRWFLGLRWAVIRLGEIAEGSRYASH